jgi:excisionase family DNA binding protein/PAS domain S-box-containing protein
MEDRVRQPQLESMMTARQVCDFLGVSLASLRRWANRGTLKGYRVGVNRQMRFRLEDVLRFLEEGGSAASTEPVDGERKGCGSVSEVSVDRQTATSVTQRDAGPNGPLSAATRPSKNGKSRLTAHIETMPEVFALLDEDLNFSGMNPAGEDVLGLPESAVVGRNILDFAPDLKETGRYGTYLDIVRSGEFSLVDHLDLRANGGNVCLDVTVLRVGDRLAITGNVRRVRERPEPAEERRFAAAQRCP